RRQRDEQGGTEDQGAGEGDHRHHQAADAVGAEADRPPGTAQPLAQQLRTRQEAEHELVDLAAITGLAAELERLARRPLAARLQPVDALGLLLVAVVAKGEEQAQQHDADAGAEQERLWRGVKCGRSPLDLKLPCSLPSVPSPSY